MASANSINKVQQLYVAYYGRAGDPAGVDFWADILDSNGGNVAEMINQFGNSPEYTNGIGSGDTSDQVTSLYQQMFNRAPEAEGLLFWASEISSGNRTLGEVAVAIAESALADDAATLANKVTAAEYFTEQASSSGASYEGANISEVQAIIASVTSDTATINAANNNSDAYVTNNSSVIISLFSTLSEPEIVEFPQQDAISKDEENEMPVAYENVLDNSEMIEIVGRENTLSSDAPAPIGDIWV